jgi:nicotinate phosphoribosyltransferase
MANGQRTEAGASRPLTALHEHAAARLAELPARLRALSPDVPPHEVALSDGLEERRRSTRRALEKEMAAEAS